ncbi:MAG: ATP-binding cassette domain-containing protein [Anaerolineales bacterium]|nr:ATP-binding cassette domain-containing protein [Anaerolineales bacterium]
MTEQNTPLVQVKNLKKYFPINRGILIQRRIGEIKAVDGVDFEIYKGETLGLVGESGSGKTTIGRTLLRLHEPTSGQIIFEDRDFLQVEAKELRDMRRRMQMIFQDPYASLNPRMTIGAIIGEPLEVHDGLKGDKKNKRVQDLLELVGINPALINRYPHEFSGGQRQRIGVARALALNPDLIVCDEPIASLDVSIQAQVVNLLEDLQNEFQLTYLFIAHDLSMVRHISDRMAVMYLGKFMELASGAEISSNPLHPYTQALMSAIPVPDPEIEEKRQRTILEGDIPSPAHPPNGCNFNTRCPLAIEICFQTDPEFKEVAPGHSVACHLVE